MTCENIEKLVEQSGYQMVVFDKGSFPQELYKHNKECTVSYLKEIIDTPNIFMNRGWKTAWYNPHEITPVINVLFVDYTTFIGGNNKLKLLNAIKKFM